MRSRQPASHRAVTGITAGAFPLAGVPVAGHPFRIRADFHVLDPKTIDKGGSLRRAGNRTDRFDRTGPDRSEPDGCRPAHGAGNGTPPVPAAGDFPARGSGHSEHSHRIHWGDHRHVAHPLTKRGKQVQRTAVALQHRSGGGKSNGSLTGCLGRGSSDRTPPESVCTGQTFRFTRSRIVASSSGCVPEYANTEVNHGGGNG